MLSSSKYRYLHFIPSLSILFIIHSSIQLYYSYHLFLVTLHSSLRTLQTIMSLPILYYINIYNINPPVLIHFLLYLSKYFNSTSIHSIRSIIFHSEQITHSQPTLIFLFHYSFIIPIMSNRNENSIEIIWIVHLWVVL